MTVRPIPKNSVEIQTGLWASGNHYVFCGEHRMTYILYSADGYCFYDVEQSENYNEDGELLPMEQRVYAQYASTAYTSIEELNKVYVSVPVRDGYEIV